jgi:GntR family transcriptional regulator, transcriptional repressor for pyruvate dehydrogenase complex
MIGKCTAASYPDAAMPHADRVSQTARRIEQAILSGKLAPGDQLPSEREISADMGVSRSVVREALGRLASMGLVRSVHGSGTRVEAPSGKPITTGYQILLKRGEVRLADVAAVRLPLETAIAAEAARRRSDEHLARMETAQAALADRRGTLDAHVRADLDFHAILAEATGNPLFGIVLTPIQELLIETRRRTVGRHGAALAHEHHARIIDAVRAGDSTAAAEAMRAHLEANYRHLSEGGESAD